MGNLSSTPSSSTTTTTDGEQYDVFLSFRGEDTRRGFTSHLYQALHQKQIKTFKDDQLVRGEEISEGLWSAIGKSKISVIIFSENYAFSKWCLRELAEIMKYREMNNQIVIPVFYEVDPSHVRKQNGSYEAAFAKHENELQQEDEVLVSFCFLLLFSSLAAVFSCFLFGWLRLCLLFLFFWAGVLGTLCLYPVFCCCLWASLAPIIYTAVPKKEDEVKKWRDALTLASSISGWDSSVARNEAEFICDIVSDVWKKLYNISPSYDFKASVGIDKRSERVVSLLCLGVPDFRIIGIWGMGGIGKSTIADAVFHLVSHQFENRTHFAVCVRNESEKDDSVIRLRDEIISKVLNEGNLKIGTHSIPERIKRRLNQTKVLIVLDDVDKLAKLEILAGGLDQFGPGSRIILTSRNAQVLRNCGAEDHNMYKVEGLNDDEALQLFCKHALKQNHPTEDLEDLSREVVKIAKDVPLFVRVLGSSLYKKSNREWENAVEKFHGNVDHEGFVALKFSYDGLDEKEKDLFLDIACFLVFQRVDVFKPNLLSDRELSLSALIDKSLVTVENGWIRMHDLLRHMGREIASKNHSRLWRQEDVIRTLKHNDGAGAVQGIFLTFSILNDEYLSSQDLKKMNNLRTLIIHYLDRTHEPSFCDLDYLSSELRYLHWKMYPLEELPSSFNPVNLVELDLSTSKIKQLWKGETCAKNLKRLNLSYCENLIKIPDLSDIPLAESINLDRCIILPEIRSRECPKNLHSLQLSQLYCLTSFPSNIHIKGSKFSLDGCIRLTEFPGISGNIKILDLSRSGIEKVPSTIQSLSKLESLNMKDCTRLRSISNSICKLKSLDRLDLSECCELESFPEGMDLKYLNLSGTEIKELPPSIGNWNRLEELFLSRCKNLEKLPRLSGLCFLKELRLDNCNLTEISEEDIGCLFSLEKLDLHRNINLKRLPESIKQLSKLYYLSVSYCRMLPSLPELPSSLRYLEAMNCKELSIPDESEIELCADGGGSFIFNFMNCLKLNQKAVSNLLIFFQVPVQKMEVMGTEKIISLFKVSPSALLPSLYILAQKRDEVEGSIFLPGSKIPKWFCYESLGSSINIPVLRNDLGRSIMGFAVCVVIRFSKYYSISNYYGRLYVHYDFHFETSDGHKEGFFCNSIPLLLIEDDEFICSDHIFLGYNLSSKCYEFFQELDTLLADRGMSDYVHTSFKFSIEQSQWRVFNNPEPVEGCEVKYCGIQPIYVKEQVMNSVSINQDTGDTSGCNDIAEETCEPHPLRICTEGNQCSTTHGL